MHKHRSLNRFSKISHYLKHLFKRPPVFNPDLPNVPHYGGNQQPQVLATEYPTDNVAQATETVPYQLRQPLLPSTHQQLFLQLNILLNQQPYQLSYQVSLSALLTPLPDLDTQLIEQAWSRIAEKSIDFVIWSADMQQIVGFMQVKPATISVAEQMQYRFIRKLCADLGIPLLQLPHKSHYSEFVLKQLLQRQFGMVFTAECPRCGSGLKPYTVRKGRLAGQTVLICSRYPACKMIQKLTATHANN